MNQTEYVKKQQIKLKECKEDLIILQKKIEKINQENYNIRIENLNLENEINKLNKIMNTILKYKKRIVLQTIECILLVILCFVVTSLIGPFAANMIGLKDLESIIISWLVFFVPFYPVSLAMFTGAFKNYFKTKKFLKKNKLNETEQILFNKINKKETNDYNYKTNMKNIQTLENAKSEVYKNIDNIFTIIINNENNKDLYNIENDLIKTKKYIKR